MGVDPEEAEAAKSVLWPNEKVEVTVRQRLNLIAGGSVITPTSVIATDKRLIILNRASLRFRTDYEVIPYKQVSTVRLEHGIISSTVFIRVLGYDKDKGLLKNGKQEGEIDGLKNTDAQELVDYINRKIGELEDIAEGEPETEGQSDRTMGAYTYCNKCGAKNADGSKFCSKCGARLAD